MKEGDEVYLLRGEEAGTNVLSCVCITYDGAVSIAADHWKRHTSGEGKPLSFGRTGFRAEWMAQPTGYTYTIEKKRLNE